jgi:hypothetical protein
MCERCSAIYWAEGCVENVTLRPKGVDEQIPPLLEYTKVFVVNREHKRYLEPGMIIARDHIHYRVKFKDGTNTWMPSHWIVAIPGGLL